MDIQSQLRMASPPRFGDPVAPLKNGHIDILRLQRPRGFQAGKAGANDESAGGTRSG